MTEICFEPLRGGGGDSAMNSNSPSVMGVPGRPGHVGSGRKGLRDGAVGLSIGVRDKKTGVVDVHDVFTKPEGRT